MAKAIFHREFHWNRPGAPFGFGAKAKPEPQHFPRDFIAAAVRAGCATEIHPAWRSSRKKDAEPEGVGETQAAPDSAISEGD